VPLLCPPLEGIQVELVAVEDECVAAWPALDRPVRQFVAQPRDVDPHRLSCRRWRLLPELINEAIERDSLPGPKQE
jgi:hypothetical protein